ncbi:MULTISPECIES: acyl-CoA dehydrogenase family protein [unclassified Nocardiopsis]|uniref:acyl-CoA dehydrogenase family protein n=1 Tax=unclassified Nocardiopsis TaxID=2649073 RepID=UPI00066A659B|nr:MULTISPECIES: acyl-CoA dehydrogenase family protein [unclassified Nocardiopsis]MBQ1082434.1 acyl-CoA dehydrogenase family protein [Nocardiopsis sp. B62]
MTDAYAFEAARVSAWSDTSHLISQGSIDELATHAEENDRSGRLADRSIDVLREAAYFGLPVPRDFEGQGATVEECCAVQRRIGAADPALAIATSMHLFSVGVVVEHWNRNHDEAWMLLEAIASQQRIVSNAFAEPGLAGALTRSNCVARRSGEDWILDGLKVPCSLAERSDLLCLQMMDEQDGEDALMVALLATRSPGIRTERTWNTLGMRATESDSVRFEQCRFSDDLVFHRTEPGSQSDEVFAAGIAWFCVASTASYLGVISAAVDESRAALQKSRITHLNASRAQLPSFQGALGDIMSLVLPMEWACAGLARQLGEKGTDPRALIPSALALKQQTAQLATTAVAMAAELVGVGSYSANGKVARLLRDAQAARYHPPTRFATRQLLGRWALGFPFGFELDEKPVGDH